MYGLDWTMKKFDVPLRHYIIYHIIKLSYCTKKILLTKNLMTFTDFVLISVMFMLDRSMRTMRLHGRL